MRDANNDGTVNFGDFVLLSNGFGMEEAATWRDGDFNENGTNDQILGSGAAPANRAA